MKIFFKIISYFILILIIDFIGSNIFLKKTEFWEYKKLLNHYWRISSDVFHHGLMPNIDVIEPWGFSLEKRLITNSIGFRDFSTKEVSKIPEKKRLLLIGDSAIEGAGYDYEFTIGGLLQNHLSDNYEVLNSAVGSYSPGIYYKKIKYYIDNGYKFNRAIIFLDPSDIIDELFLNFDEKGNFIIEKNNTTNISNFFLDNFLIFRTFLRVSDATESLKNFIKLKYKASKKYGKSFFDTSNEDTMYYRMTHVDRSAWTFDDTLFRNYKDGLSKSELHLNKLVKLLKDNNIDLDFILYPHPSQIAFEDLYHQPYWINWAKQNNINLISLYPNFQGTNKREIVFDTFIFGDLHWNKNGTNIVFNALINKINF